MGPDPKQIRWGQDGLQKWYGATTGKPGTLLLWQKSPDRNQANLDQDNEWRHSLERFTLAHFCAIMFLCQFVQKTVTIPVGCPIETSSAANECMPCTHIFLEFVHHAGVRLDRCVRPKLWCWHFDPLRFRFWNGAFKTRRGCSAVFYFSSVHNFTSVTGKSTWLCHASRTRDGLLCVWLTK